MLLMFNQVFNQNFLFNLLISLLSFSISSGYFSKRGVFSHCDTTLRIDRRCLKRPLRLKFVHKLIVKKAIGKQQLNMVLSSEARSLQFVTKQGVKSSIACTHVVRITYSYRLCRRTVIFLHFAVYILGT